MIGLCDLGVQQATLAAEGTNKRGWLLRSENFFVVEG